MKPTFSIYSLARRIIRSIGWVFLGLLGAIFLYVASAYLLLLIPANAQGLKNALTHSDTGVRVWVLDNGVHTDLVMPIESIGMNWRAVFAPEHFVALAKDVDLIAIGWGDRGFYLNTPNWSDLKLKTALQAVFGANESLLHVEYLSTTELPEYVYEIQLSRAQYRELVNYVMQSVTRTSAGARAISGAHYGHNDAFFQANGHYSLLQTCNTWTGAGLRAAGVKVSRWTPLPNLVTWYLPLAQRIKA